jgi:hypothetical protein
LTSTTAPSEPWREESGLITLGTRSVVQFVKRSPIGNAIDGDDCIIIDATNTEDRVVFDGAPNCRGSGSRTIETETNIRDINLSDSNSQKRKNQTS